ncbi:MAG: response regulator, partial [bacterium]|nr:response regulator [bacterium]
MALVVSADADDRKWAARWLQREGFEVLLAKNTAQMLEEFERAAPDVVIVGAKQGIETCTALRQAPVGEEVPILVLVSR